MYDILYPIIEHYIGGRVNRVKRAEDLVFFETSLGKDGRIEKNTFGNWDLTVNEEKIAEIEDILFSIFCEAKDQPPIDNYYKKLISIRGRELNYRSNVLVEQLITSIEYLLLHPDVKINNPISFGCFFIFEHEGIKQIIVLN
jgi:hypothetical protein